MFKIGDTVVYEALGVCRVIDIRHETFEPLPPADYYVLELLYGARTTVYAPVHNEKIRIRATLDKEAVLELIRSMPDARTSWVSNDTERAERFRAILKSGDRSDLVRLLKTLHLKRDEQRANGRKFHAADERIMQEAEKLLFEEFAYALNIRPEDVVPYITGKLDDLQNGF